jgi:hypothetical protein
MEDRYDALKAKEDAGKVDALVGRCFQQDIYDNDSYRAFIKVLDRLDSGYARVLALEMPTAEDVASGSETLEKVELHRWSYRKISFDKEISSISFDKRLSEIIAFLEGCKSKRGKKANA